MFRRVGKFLAHAVIVVGEITERDNGADNDRRVGGRAAYPTSTRIARMYRALGTCEKVLQ